MKKVIIFDIDGVLFDTIPHAEKYFLEEYTDVPGDIYKRVNAGNYHEEKNKISHLKKPLSEVEERERVTGYEERKSNLPMFPGMKELLEKLHASGVLLVSNTGAYKSRCVPGLEKAGVIDLFDFIATAETSKSKSEKFKIIEEKYQIPKSEMVFITDALGDLKEAQISGVSTIAVTWGVHDATYFDKEKYSCLVGVANTVSELEEMIKKS
ncbi:MAG: HAD family hydrolase [bacterium]